MADRQAAEARAFDTTYWRDRAKAARGIAAELGEDEPSPVEGMLAACDAVDALSVRLAQAEARERAERDLREIADRERDKAQDRWAKAEQERDEADGQWAEIGATQAERAEKAEARLREYEEALQIGQEEPK